MKNIITVLLFFIITSLASCAQMRPHYEVPGVGLKSFRMVPAKTGSLPEFEIGLHVINPNRSALPLEGLFYTVSLDGERLISGVANNLPTIEGYGEADIKIIGTVDLLGGIQLLKRFLGNQQPSMKYTFAAKLDTGHFTPPITIKEEGKLSSLFNDNKSNSEKL